MFRRSHLDSLTQGQGIDFFSQNICEDHLIGDLLWKQRAPEEVQGEFWGKHAMLFGDLAVQPMANMSVREYWSRRVRWLRVRKFTVTLATLVEPGTECFLCSAYGAFAVSHLPLFYNKMAIPQTWTAFAWFWLLSVAIWCAMDRVLYLHLHSAKSIEVDEHTPSFARPPKAGRRRVFGEWLLAWLGREALALPIWVWAFWGGTKVQWRNRRFWVGMDMKVHEIREDEASDGSDLDRHIREEWHFPACGACGKAFNNPAKLANHQSGTRHKGIKFAKDYAFVCSCGFLAPCFAVLKQHRTSHKDSGYYSKSRVVSQVVNDKSVVPPESSRAYCGRSFKTLGAFEQHRRDVEHAVTRYPSTSPVVGRTGCGRTFADVAAIEQHRRDVAHDTTFPSTEEARPSIPALCERPLTCCGKLFESAEALEQHSRDKKHGITCTLPESCNTRFETPSALEMHMEGGVCISGKGVLLLDKVVSLVDQEHIPSDADQSAVLVVTAGKPIGVVTIAAASTAEPQRSLSQSLANSPLTPAMARALAAMPMSAAFGRRTGPSTSVLVGYELDDDDDDDDESDEDGASKSTVTPDVASCRPHSSCRLCLEKRPCHCMKDSQQTLDSTAHVPRIFHHSAMLTEMSSVEAGKQNKIFGTLRELTQHLEPEAGAGGKGSYRKVMEFVGVQVAVSRLGDEKNARCAFGA
ncbi:hypothetical protein B0A55_04919 [Friedmanniomyces simplex]|uniref:C2H2-type domain-containing protein n=1 Tax=Friedmanniomyces simplex TaxID=329884 RepID=A0A4U0XKJ6_9PEZI|nr:hypothetical protein B0A55_04919 [Friedmanniomyces simplex]